FRSGRKPVPTPLHVLRGTLHSRHKRRREPKLTPGRPVWPSGGPGRRCGAHSLGTPRGAARSDARAHASPWGRPRAPRAHARRSRPLPDTAVVDLDAERTVCITTTITI